jgi:hypothetical protein
MDGVKKVKRIPVTAVEARRFGDIEAPTLSRL